MLIALLFTIYNDKLIKIHKYYLPLIKHNVETQNLNISCEFTIIDIQFILISYN